ncbi:MAG: hypothetical protein N2738_03180 [Thermodesulfovibrionales bacterium]|nr:hypothetical protein [Thermodesulfovibrionales bacterium]
MLNRKDKIIEYISNQGPKIDIIYPQLSDTLKNPLKIEIRFCPKEGNSVNLSTLKVELIKIIPIDITSMILPYANENGIFADNISLPTGRHKLRFTIFDNEKNKTQLIYNISVI